MKTTIQNHISASIACKQEILNSSMTLIEDITQIVVDCFRNGKSLHLCGNGGSASDAQHIAAELSGRYKMERNALPAESLNNNTSAITAIANDYGYDAVYERLLQSRGVSGDCLIAISTSGNSPNVCRAAQYAKDNGIIVIGLTGNMQSKLSSICDVTCMVPSIDTPIIQESHIMIGHIICHLVEEALFQS